MLLVMDHLHACMHAAVPLELGMDLSTQTSAIGAQSADTAAQLAHGTSADQPG